MPGPFKRVLIEAIHDEAVNDNEVKSFDSNKVIRMIRVMAVSENDRMH